DRQQRLAERVVELVCSRMEQVLALQVEALVGREPLGERDRRGTAPVRAAELVELRPEPGVWPRLPPARLELVQCGDQRLRHEAASVLAVGQLHRAAFTYARTRAWSLTPGSSSRLELASTAHGRTVSIASRTFSGERPPARTTRPAAAR